MTNFLDDGRKFDNEEERFAAFTIAQEASLLTELEEHLDSRKKFDSLYAVEEKKTLFVFLPFTADKH